MLPIFNSKTKSYGNTEFGCGLRVFVLQIFLQKLVLSVHDVIMVMPPAGT